MDDEQILERGGTEEDIKEYAKQNGTDLTREDFYFKNENEVDLFDQISIASMQSIMAKSTPGTKFEHIAKWSYQNAFNMLKERRRRINPEN